MLTKKQHELLIFINDRLQASGVCPSFDEMKNALRLKSKSGIHRLITGLEERGFIRRLPHRARALEILRLPDGQIPGSPVINTASAEPQRPKNAPVPGFQATVIDGGFGSDPVTQPDSAPAPELVEIPLFGRIAAGTPIEALRDPQVSVAVPPSMLGRGRHYALQVEGDSMIEAGILDGDIAVIREGQMADTGQVVVALVDDNEVTLKRLRRRGKSIALEPANAAYETRIFGPDRVRVQGVLKGILRIYD